MTKTAEEYYLESCNNTSDINEHLPILKKYAEKSKHITEMGVRTVVSTFSLILSKPQKMISIDIKHPCSFGACDRLKVIEEYSIINNIDYNFILSNTLDIEIENTDLLFIDTLHTYEQLKRELELHSNKVNKYIIFHDTELFANKNEVINGIETPQRKNGIIPAINEFLQENKNWKILEKFLNNNGLMVIGKIKND